MTIIGRLKRETNPPELQVPAVVPFQGIDPDTGSYNEFRLADGSLQVATGMESAARRGRAFMASSGKMTLVAGAVRATLSNPANSGRMLYLQRLALFSTATTWCDVYLNPNGTNQPASVRRANALYDRGIVAKGILKADSGTVLLGLGTGGIDMQVSFGVGANMPYPVPLSGFVLPPGGTFALNLGGALTASASVDVWWAEEDIAV